MRTKNARDVQKRLMVEGWIWLKRRGHGSHRIFVHPDRQEQITVPWHGNGQQSLSPGTYHVIAKTAGWKR
jgi:predicted RNA binding protein YcfA (HicA-like mRNA interferase family)